MKTLKDLEEMKTKPNNIFETQYKFFFANLENYYLDKFDGTERIKAELSNWDKEAQGFIMGELIEMVSKSGIMGFDKSELLSLLD